jgi:glycosyltransferase involved in cell wall biosynthesis
MSERLLPSVSVVLAVSNAESTIAECIESLVALRYPRELLEIVVVDNGSIDGTRSILDRFGDAVVVVEERTRGPAAARNAGVRRARGDVIALTDVDCTVDPGWLEAVVAPLADEAVGIGGGPILARRPANAAELYGETIHDQSRAILEWKPPHVATGNWAARRALFDVVGPFDEDLLRGSDFEFSYRVVAAGYQLAFSPGAVVFHRNESTLVGLFNEGWVHGRHGGRIVRRRAELVARAKARSTEDATGVTAPPPPDPMPLSRYAFAFQSGRRLGRAAARIEVAADRVAVALRGSRPPADPRA